MGAINAIVELFRYFVSWVPFPLKVLTTQRAVKFRTVSWGLVGNRKYWTTFKIWNSPVPEPHVLPPGFYWFIPAITDIVIFVSVEDNYSIPSRFVIAADGKTLSIRSELTCRITGPKKAATSCESIPEMIRVQGIRAQNSLASACDFLKVSQTERNGGLLMRARELLSNFGVTVTRASIEVGEPQLRHHIGVDNLLVDEL